MGSLLLPMLPYSPQLLWVGFVDPFLVNCSWQH